MARPKSADQFTFAISLGWRVHYHSGIRAGQTARGIRVLVRNQATQGTYTVSLLEHQDGNRWTCTCPHYLNRLAGTVTPCKHILAVKAELAPVDPAIARALDLERTERQQRLQD